MEKTFNQKFIKANQRFWVSLKEPETDELLFVETSTHPVMSHANAIVAKMVAKAKNWRIAWMEESETDDNLMKSYSSNSLFIKIPQLKFTLKLQLIVLALYYYLYYIILINKPFLCRYKNIPYGDFIYDFYLAEYSMATFHRFNPGIILIIFRILMQDEKARLLLRSYPIKGILVNHYIGHKTGPLSRVALQKKIPVYWKGGGHEIINLAVLKNLGDIYHYAIKPTSKIIDLLVKKDSTKIASDFNKFIRSSQSSPYYNPLSVAYHNNLSSKMDKKRFLKKLQLPNKSIIFVMLHAFNDHPRSHYKKMLFNDYYDWFVQTLEFAKKDKTKNWIFKEHPGNKYYPTKDLNLKKMMVNLPKHLRFISQNSQINAATVLNVADTIVTCIGTAGIEIPAIKGIPSIVAGSTFYDGLGFTLEPRSKKQYFKNMKHLQPTKLTPTQQLRAKCCYLYLNKYCAVPFAAGPQITYEENKLPRKLQTTYSKRILKTYHDHQQLIYNQFNEYVSKIRKRNFVRLEKLSSDLKNKDGK